MQSGLFGVLSYLKKGTAVFGLDRQIVGPKTAAWVLLCLNSKARVAHLSNSLNRNLRFANGRI
jgi:hypothetical protein